MNTQNHVWDAATEAARLENLRTARTLIHSTRAHHVPVDYMPGQVWYNFAEYPGEPLSPPTEEDARNFATYRERGVGLIHIHEEWNDSQEIYGADKFTPNNPKAYGQFIELMHSHGLKIIPYFSSGYYDIRGKHYDPRWAVSFGGKPFIHEGKRRWYRYGLCSPASPSWRAFLLGNIERMFDSYPIDGLYNDVGYDTMAFADLPSPDMGQAPDAFEESPDADGSLEDLIQEIHGIVRRHGGVSLIHFGKYYRRGMQSHGFYGPKLKTYDYNWVGERVGGLNEMQLCVKDLPPYVMYIPDWSVVPADQRPIMYALSIPYLQFPVLYHGRPVKGKVYRGEKKFRYDPATGQCEACLPSAVGAYCMEHPDAAPTYSQWYGPTPGDPKLEEHYWHYLAIYRRMTKPGSHVFVDVQDQSLLSGPRWPHLVLSAFVNDAFFLAAVNYNAAANMLNLREPWKDVESGKISRQWTLKPYQLLILEKPR